MNRNSPGPDTWRSTLLTGAAVAMLALARPLCDLSNHQTTPRGGHYTHLFPDHSVVEINTDTSMSFDFSTRHRGVTLAHGEAFFRVTDRNQLPFSVLPGNVSV
jgi:ferric-dicitrate binding protein FerR (iron transport regulator)